MAIAEDGRWFGYLSGGCAEYAISCEGVSAIKEGENRSVRYGVGSPYLDIQLPCGAGIDIWFDQSFEPMAAETILQNLANRMPSYIQQPIDVTDAVSVDIPKAVNRGSAGNKAHCPRFRRWYFPKRLLYIVGTGPGVSALAALATEADYQVSVLTPDSRTLCESQPYTNQCDLLENHKQIESLHCDALTSVVLMFHEHERETEILRYFLSTDAVYIGALGSARSHGIRLDLLNDSGINASQAKRIHGPVGLRIHARTPIEIAISILAELTLEYQAAASPLLDLGDD